MGPVYTSIFRTAEICAARQTDLTKLNLKDNKKPTLQIILLASDREVSPEERNLTVIVTL